MKQFEGKSVLVTGGNSGIGLAAAIAFAKEGARVVFTGRDQTTLDKVAARLGANAIAVRNDAGSVADGIKLATLLQQQGSCSMRSLLMPASPSSLRSKPLVKTPGMRRSTPT